MPKHHEQPEEAEKNGMETVTYCCRCAYRRKEECPMVHYVCGNWIDITQNWDHCSFGIPKAETGGEHNE